MARTRTVTLGWTRPATDEEFRVTLNVTPGTPDRGPDMNCAGGYPGDPPEIEVVEVCEDAPGGAARDDLIAEVEADLTSLEDRAFDAAREDDAAAEEDAADRDADRRLNEERETSDAIDYSTGPRETRLFHCLGSESDGLGSAVPRSWDASNPKARG